MKIQMDAKAGFSNRFFRRPLAGLHWAFLGSLLAGWFYIFLLLPCSDPVYFGIFIYATTISATLINGFRLADGLAGWAKVGRVLVVAGRDLLIFFVAILIATTFLPAYQCIRSKDASATASWFKLAVDHVPPQLLKPKTALWLSS